jgi:hypothetical protein
MMTAVEAPIPAEQLMIVPTNEARCQSSALALLHIENQSQRRAP